MTRLAFEDVSVHYAIYNARSQSLRNHLLNVGTGGRIAQEMRHTITVTALDSVSFDFKDGDRVGLVGHNGAGKTTMLRTMAGIFQPNSGRVIRDGDAKTIIELGAGMDSELSGYENIIRMGLLGGASKSDMVRATPEIERFTELGSFLAMPVRTYSTGMIMRLMFAAATASRPKILLIDEMFGAGDAEFQERAQQRMHELIDAASIFVFASHAKDLIKKYCNRLLQLEHGKVREIPLSSL
jgi:ABC-type polysaccharide/polyol phosphate transport system ATPase subunit